MTQISDLKAKMQASTRKVKVIAAGMNELTILGRTFYNDPDEQRWLQRTNEAIHRLSGHLRDLCDRGELYTPSRADGIFEQLKLLPEESLKRLYEFTA